MINGRGCGVESFPEDGVGNVHAPRKRQQKTAPLLSTGSISWLQVKIRVGSKGEKGGMGKAECDGVKRSEL